jgi:hypothetical protein
MAKLIGWLDMLSALGGNKVRIEVVKDGNSVLLARPFGAATIWRRVDSNDPQYWISEAVRVWHELQVEGSSFRLPELKELDS